MHPRNTKYNASKCIIYGWDCCTIMHFDNSRLLLYNKNIMSVHSSQFSPCAIGYMLYNMYVYM